MYYAYVNYFFFPRDPRPFVLSARAVSQISQYYETYMKQYRIRYVYVYPRRAAVFLSVAAASVAASPRACPRCSQGPAGNLQLLQVQWKRNGVPLGTALQMEACVNCDRALEDLLARIGGRKVRGAGAGAGAGGGGHPQQPQPQQQQVRQ